MTKMTPMAHTAQPAKQTNLTRRALALAVSAGTGFSQRDSSDMVDAFFRVMKNTMIAGEPIKLVQFGSFLVRDKAGRRGRNPRTGEEITIAERRRITFRPSQALRDRLNHEQA